MAKILVISPEYPPYGGGAATALKELMGHLPMDLLQVSVKRKSRHYLTNWELVKWTWRARRAFLALKNKYDLILCWFAFPSGLVCWGTDIPYVVSFQGSDVPGHNRRFKYVEFLLRSVYKHIWRKAKVAIVNSQYLKECAQKFYNIPITIIPNGIDSSKYYPPSKLVSRNKILTVARLIPSKRIDLAIDYAESAGRTLTIVGDGPLRKELEKYADTSAIFLGEVARKDMPDIYRKHGTFVLFSVKEGCCNAALEAKACGLKMVVTSEIEKTSQNPCSWKKTARLYKRYMT